MTIFDFSRNSKVYFLSSSCVNHIINTMFWLKDETEKGNGTEWQRWMLKLANSLFLHIVSTKTIKPIIHITEMKIDFQIILKKNIFLVKISVQYFFHIVKMTAQARSSCRLRIIPIFPWGSSRKLRKYLPSYSMDPIKVINIVLVYHQQTEFTTHRYK